MTLSGGFTVVTGAVTDGRDSQLVMVTLAGDTEVCADVIGLMVTVDVVSDVFDNGTCQFDTGSPEVIPAAKVAAS